MPEPLKQSIEDNPLNRGEPAQDADYEAQTLKEKNAERRKELLDAGWIETDDINTVTYDTEVMFHRTGEVNAGLLHAPTGKVTGWAHDPYYPDKPSPIITRTDGRSFTWSGDYLLHMIRRPSY